MTKLKARFDTYIQKYAVLKEEFDNFNASDIEKANEKLALMRAKAE